MKKVLIVVDMQADFVTGALGSPDAQAVVGPIGEKIAEYRKNNWPVIFTADTHTQEEYAQNRSQESTRIPRHCVKGEPGWQIVPQLDPQDSPIVEKPGFLSLELQDAIGPLEPEDVIELCGICTDICVVSNALHLRARYPLNKIVVLKGLCAGTSRQNHEAALAVLGSCLVDAQ